MIGREEQWVRRGGRRQPAPRARDTANWLTKMANSCIAVTRAAMPECVDLVLLMPDDEEESHSFSWRASQQELADGRIRLSVSGTCNHPTVAHRVSLSRSPFQPSNPHILLLTFKAELVAGAVALQGPTATVTYEQTSNQRYKLVSIQPGGIGVAVIDEHMSGSRARAPDQD